MSFGSRRKQLGAFVINKINRIYRYENPRIYIVRPNYRFISPKLKNTHIIFEQLSLSVQLRPRVSLHDVTWLSMMHALFYCLLLSLCYMIIELFV
jgi:hypothetical protein